MKTFLNRKFTPNFSLGAGALCPAALKLQQLSSPLSQNATGG
jgi:hypothetical protein